MSADMSGAQERVPYLQRPLRPADYLLSVTALALVELLVRVTLLGDLADVEAGGLEWLVLVSSPTSVARHLSDVELWLWLVTGLATSGAVMLLSLRRARDAGQGEIAAALAMIPILRIPLVIYLAAWPGARRDDADEPPDAAQAARRWVDASVAVLVAAALVVMCVALGALVFNTYEYGLFLFSPLLVGGLTGWLVNRRGDVGAAYTLKVVWIAALVGSAALLALALEGLLCILAIAPLGFLVAMPGGLIGRLIALRGASPRLNAIGGVLLLPLVFGADAALQNAANFEVRSAVHIAAPPAAVWNSLLQLRPIEEEPGLVFRLGIAYPMRGETRGEGVGAIRHGEFSTGTGIARVTAWVENRELSFVPISEPAAMRELSFYDDVHAPHVRGYFRTVRSTFRLEPQAGGGTLLIAHTQHALTLEPAAYWLPMARWVVRENLERVLRHVRGEAEEGGAPERLPLTH